ncbi:substrate-binding periplasmic protein [Pseudophaeobacter flagellatus]|uniref:substrate-binding periplasmic protein n=1 Tax=Pseudophaeobacter flagellatus TaxID=2899119 RepID=UPI001E32FC07|nr:transporter substrate-binding domain-containing protein [Pseudophaeobacter flagellatus]MCD9146514.1 transporter substrate-binding domain-containing protein [Pseudophaeobacter flagellatus]
MTSLKALICSAAFASFASVSMAGTTLTLLTEEYPPYNFTENGEIVGSATDLVREAMDAAGVGYTIKSLPWARAFSNAQKDPGTCVFTTNITEKRRPLFKWISPLLANQMVLVASASNPITINSLEDARAYTIGTYTDDVAETHMKDAGMNTVSTAKEELNIKKLKAGRIDLWVTFRERLNLLNDPDLVEVFMVDETVAGVACNLSVDDATIASIQASLDALIASGRAADIKASYR